jgi:hypothetical protein
MKTGFNTIAASKNRNPIFSFAHSKPQCMLIINKKEFQESKCVILYNRGITQCVAHGFLIVKLDLSDNSLRSFSIMNLPNLTTLDVSNNRLTYFSTLDRPNLKELSLRNNKIKTFSAKTLQNIKCLNLSDNLLTSFGPVELPNIRSLDIAGNRLTSFVSEGLENVRDLYLFSNHLSRFYGLNLVNIRMLYIQNNPSLTILGIERRSYEFRVLDLSSTKVEFVDPTLIDIVVPPIKFRSHILGLKDMLESSFHPGSPIYDEIKDNIEE